MEVKLVVVGSEALSSAINLELPAALGRGREAGLSLPHALVSRRHCELYESEDRLRICDLGPLKDTFAGSERIEDEKLAPSVLLTVGTATFPAVCGDGDVVSQSSVELSITSESSDFDQSILEADNVVADEPSTMSGDEDSEHTRVGNRLGKPEDIDLI